MRPKGWTPTVHDARRQRTRGREPGTAQGGKGRAGESGVAPKSDPMAARLAAVVPGLTEEAVLLYQPLALPLTISLLGILLIAAGARPARPVKPVVRKGKRKRKTRKAKAQASVKPTNVVPIRRRA